jgi:signal transduction histidine kinase
MNLLLLEDSPSDAFLVMEALKRASRSDITVRHVESLGDAEDLLRTEQFDAALLDLGLPDCEGVDSVKRLHAAHPLLPIVVLTGMDDEAMALAALHSGADDYLVKGEADPKVLMRVLRYAIERRQMAAERRALERGMHEAQRHDSLLALAGGVAHHYNNLLAVILGYTEALVMGGDLTEDQRHDLDQITRAAERAAHISQQMAVFSGSGFFTIELLDLNRLIQDLQHTSASIVAPPLLLEYHLSPGLPRVLGTTKAISQALESLLHNAVEASTGTGGVVHISTGATVCDANDLAKLHGFGNMEAGVYVFLEVRDPGVGMDAEAQNRMFEPFYSTKFVGRGMGLAVVMGIVALHRGGIEVRSNPGEGTTIRIHFPVPPVGSLANPPMP